MGAITSRFGSVKAAIEGAYGQGAASASDDALLLSGEPSVREMGTVVDRTTDMVKPTRGGFKHVRLKSHVEYAFPVRVGELDTSQDGGTPAVGPLLVMGGFEEATSGAAADSDLEAVYTPLTVGHGSGQIDHMLKDRDTGQVGLHTVVGCRHNFTMNWSVGNDLILDIQSGRGMYSERQAFAAGGEPTTLGLGLAVYKVQAITFTVDGETLHISEFTFSPNWSPAQDDSLAADATGQEQYLDAQGRAGGSFNPKAMAEHWSQDGLVDKLRGADEIAVKAVATGQNSTITLDLPAIQYTERQLQADGGTYRHSLSYECNEENALSDDWATITFAQA